MKKSLDMILAAIAMTLGTTSAMSADSTYIPWTFDDFNSNDEVVDIAEYQVQQVSAAVLEMTDDDEVGELGW